MINRIASIHCLVVFTGILIWGFGHLYAQEPQTGREVRVTGIIVDSNGDPLGNVMVRSYLSRQKSWSEMDGTVSLEVSANDHLYFSKEGYQNISLATADALVSDTIVLARSDEIGDDSRIPVNFDRIPAALTTGSVFRVSGEDLRKNPTNDLMQALSGLVPGFFIRQTSNTPGSVTYDKQLRGESPVILLDGVPRDIVIDLQEIEEVIVYRDHAAAAMYGDLGSGGIINIITRRGRPNTKLFEVDYQYGVNTPLALPDFPDAYQNALLNNQARLNDGLSPRYGTDALDAFRTGSDPLRYPDIHYYQDYLLRNTPSHQITTSFMGGDSTIQYDLHGSYLSNRGLEKVGERINYDRLLLRSNLGIQLNEIIRMDMGITGWMDLSRYPRMGKDGMFGIMSSYPAYATPMMMGDSIYLINRDYPENLLSKLTAEGFSQSIKRTLNFNLGLDFNLDKLVRGLSMKHYISLDLYNELVTGKGGNPNLYEPLFTTNAAGEDTVLLKIYQQEVQDLDIGHVGDDINRHYTYYVNLDYNREFGSDHFIGADLLYFQNALERRGKTGDQKNQMLNGKINYNYASRYIIDLFMSYTGTQKLVGSHKFHFFPGLGIAWILSSEPFMKTASAVNFLKFRASYGESGYFNIDEYYVYRDTWYASPHNVVFGTKDKNSDYPAYELTQTGNPEASWPVIKKINIGLDGSFFNHSLGLTVDAYRYSYTGQLDQLFDLYSGMAGGSQFIPFENYNASERWGLESGISVHDRSGKFYYTVGLNAGWSVERYSQVAELDYPDSYRAKTGERTDALWGLESDGLFRDQEEISVSAVQQFGAVFPGDIKYIDQNNDHVIDEKDEVIIGHASPVVNAGIRLELGWGNFSLYLQGAGTLGSDLVLNNTYFWNEGMENYSPYMLENYPRLSTYGSSNNYRMSDYWISNGSFFRLKTAELSYQLPPGPEDALKTGLRIFIRGNNLFTLSGFKELDPENVNAGITIYPLYRTISAGLSILL